MCHHDPTLRIEQRCIGPGHPCFVIAEIGSNHNGELDTALRYIDEAARIGADAVKFQTIHLDKFLADRVIVDGKLLPNEAKAQARFIEVPRDWYPTLFARARARGLLAFSAPFDLEAVDMLVEAGMPLVKLASGEVTHLRLLRKVGATKLPVILSTGMATLGEVERALDTLRGAGCPAVALLHCVSSYPTPFEEVNLRALQTLRAAFDVPVGLSDHTPGAATAVAAVALGADLIEKHITFGRQLPGTDHFFAMEIAEFATMVQQVRQVESALGNGRKGPSPTERGRMARVRRGLYAAGPLPQGRTIREENLVAMRPQHDYIRADELDRVVGLRAPRAYQNGEPLRWVDFA
jgi:sialic acid synthase SpsE